MNQPQRPMPRSNPKVPVVPSSPKVAVAPVASTPRRTASPARPTATAPAKATSKPETTEAQIVEPSSPRAVAVRRPAAPVAPEASSLRAYVALGEDLALEHVEPHRTAFFDSIAKVQAVTMIEQNARVVSRLSAPEGSRALADVRGYEREDLFAVAELGYHYLMNGGVKLAVTLFEGLTAVAPAEPYFALALALAYDHQGDKSLALAWYQKAGQLDPFDPRADLNRAELLLESRDLRGAKPLLERALAKAQHKHDEALTRKATAILSHVLRSA